MRKNRHNNGYVGSVPASQTTQGVISPSKIELLKQKYLSPYPTNNIYKYNRPTNGGGYGATASATIKNGVLSGVYVVEQGGGYTSDPIVAIYGAGVTTYATPTRSGNRLSTITPWYKVKEVVITDGGIGYSSAPTITFDTPSNSSATFTASISDTTLTVTARSSGIIFPGQLIAATGVASNTIITDYLTGTGDTGTYAINNSQTVTSRSMSTLSRANATATVSGGKVQSVTVTYPGAKYTTASSISFTSGGSPFSSAQGYVVMETGSGYTQAPIVSIIPTNTGYTGQTLGEARAIAKIKNAELDTITIINGGQNYTSEPTVAFLGNEFQQYNNFNIRATVSGGAVTGITWDPGYAVFEEPPKILIGGWTPLPSLTQGDEKLVGAFAVYNNDSNMVALSCGNTYTVDWGDGTTQNYNRNVVAEKRYDTTTYSGLTLQDDYQGYKTLLITVTPQAGFSFSSINLNQKHSLIGRGSDNRHGTNWLDIAIAGPTLNNLEIASTLAGSFVIDMGLLEKFVFVGTHNFGAAAGRAGNMSSLFRQLRNIKTIVPPSFKNMVSVINTFADCFNLVELPDELDTSSVLTWASFMNGCSSLPKLPKLNTRLASSMVQAFYDCRSLKYAPQFDLHSCTSMANMFGNCYNLIYIPPMLNTYNVTTFASTFNGCYSLEDAPYMDTSKGTDFGNMFAGCYSLKTVPEYDTSYGNAFNAMFSTCHSLQKVPKFNTSRGTNFSQMFQNCYSLREIPQLDTTFATNVNSMFTGCYSIKTVPYMDFSKVTIASQLFYQCYNLETVPRLDLSNATSVSYLFSSCSRLRHIPYVNFYSATDYSNTFSYCESLQKIDELILNPRPTVTTFSTMFDQCRALKEIPSCNMFGSTGASKTSSLSNVFGTAFGWLRSLTRVGATGMCHSFSISSSLMGATQLNEVYTNLPVVGASGAGVKTVTITGNWGRTADSPIIAISKGWTVTG